MTNELAEAIRIIEEARQSHVWWRDHLADPENHQCSSCTLDTRKLVETAAEQNAWVDKYDLVLRVLTAAGACPSTTDEGVRCQRTELHKCGFCAAHCYCVSPIPKEPQ